MTLNFTLIALGFFGIEDISNLPFTSKEERIEAQKNVAIEMLTKARESRAGCKIASDGPKEREIIVCADHTRFNDIAGIEVVIPSLIIANYPSDLVELARDVVWLNTKQIPLKVSHVTSNNLHGLTAVLNGDKLTVYKTSGDVLCTALLGPYLENVRTLLVAK